ncbi:SAVED domain-containing protein [Microbacterium sp. NPDC076911]|uniref:SAVED domain-containing protein n=1 Tax=Microbacterium sp. NPDC076911 TaxID=3154958 RepID=UPI003414222E
MTQMPSATGVRIAGDDYQWLAVWRACLQLLHEHEVDYGGNRLISIGVEARGAGNADDVVLRRESPPHTFTQVKYAVDASSPLNIDYLQRGRILAKLVETHRTLTADGSPTEIRLLTNRQIDPGDTLLRDRDGRDGRLIPRALQGSPNTDRGRARAAWASAADVGLDVLERFLEDFHVESGRDVGQLRSDAQLLMSANGLANDDRALQLGLDWVADRVIAGERELSLGAITAAIDEMGLVATEPWKTLSIATVDHDPLAAESAASIDRVDRMEGDSPYSRIRPLVPYTWVELSKEVSSVARSLAPGRVLVTGYMRQAVGFLVGAEMRMVRGYTVAVKQRAQLWTSETPVSSVELVYEEIAVGNGTDLGVIVQIAYAGATDAVDWIHATKLPVSSIHVVSAPVVGATAIANASVAHSIATAVRDHVRSRLGGSERIHLFLIGPLGLSVLLGHHWSRMRPTTVYEHLGGYEYEEAFRIDA